ncbi:MAG: ABC transporter permease [Dysgonomonas sp.]
MLKQNKFTSIITISGTALAIMMIMTLIITQEIKTISVTPESNRSRTMYIKWRTLEKKDNKAWRSSGPMSYNEVKNYISEMKSPEIVSAIIPENSFFINIVTTGQKRNKELVDMKSVDHNYWKIMTFNFVEGDPFTEADFNSALKKTVISESLAKKLFGNEGATGKKINLNFEEFTVTGVVKNVSPVFKYAYADMWTPYTTNDMHKTWNIFKILLLAKDKKDFDTITKEARSVEQKYNATEDFTITLRGPYKPDVEPIEAGSDREPDIASEKWKMVFILTILVLIPAINLLSFSLYRMRKRTEEIGVRKSFGAKKQTILFQVLYENMITSLIGGILGLALSFITVNWLKNWLLGVDSASIVPLNTLISPFVFVAVFTVCFIINVLSAGIPAYKAARMNIVRSLNQNKK